VLHAHALILLPPAISDDDLRLLFDKVWSCALGSSARLHFKLLKGSVDRRAKLAACKSAYTAKSSYHCELANDPNLLALLPHLSRLRKSAGGLTRAAYRKVAEAYEADKNKAKKAAISSLPTHSTIGALNLSLDPAPEAILEIQNQRIQDYAIEHSGLPRTEPERAIRESDESPSSRILPSSLVGSSDSVETMLGLSD